jgi:hypothetical protein
MEVGGEAGVIGWKRLYRDGERSANDALCTGCS